MSSPLTPLVIDTRLAISLQIAKINRERTKTILSQHQKFRKALSVAQELSSLASEVGMAEFEERLSLLKQLRETWANGRKARIQAVSNDNEGSLYLQLSDHRGRLQ